MVGGYYDEKWKQPYNPGAGGTGPNPLDYPKIISDPNSASKEDLENLRNEVLEMKELLKRAIKYDETNNEPHCEMEDKVATIKKVAEIVGVDLKDLI